MASALQTAVLLNNNDFQFESAGQWEKQVFIVSLKTFNKVVGLYNTDLPEGTNGYNMTLFKILNDTYNKHKAEGFKFV